MFEQFDTIESTVRSINRVPELTDNDSSLQLYFYDYMPNMLGFLVNDNYLFLTYCHWEHVRNELVLRAGGTDYFVYNKSDDFGGSECIKRFSGWLEYIRLQDTKSAKGK